MRAKSERTIGRHAESGNELQRTTARQFGEDPGMCRHCMEQSRYYYREIPPVGTAYSWDGPYCGIDCYYAKTAPALARRAATGHCPGDEV